jgi:hypothetical protein
MAAAACICYGPHAPALVEGADCDTAVTQSLQCHGTDEGGFARAGWPEDQRMADVADVQVHSERRGAGGGSVEERRRRLWVERAGVLFAACPNAGQGSMSARLAVWISGRRPFGTGWPGSRAEPRFYGVDRLNASGKAFALDFPGDQPGVLG